MTFKNYDQETDFFISKDFNIYVIKSETTIRDRYMIRRATLFFATHTNFLEECRLVLYLFAQSPAISETIKLRLGLPIAISCKQLSDLMISGSNRNIAAQSKPKTTIASSLCQQRALNGR